MSNGKGIENGKKNNNNNNNNRYIILAKQQLCTCSTLFLYLLLPLLFGPLHRETAFLWHLLWRCSMFSQKKNAACVTVRCLFHCRSHHHYKIFMLRFLRNSSPLCFVSRSSSFSVIHVSLDDKA